MLLNLNLRDVLLRGRGARTTTILKYVRVASEPRPSPVYALGIRIIPGIIGVG